MVYMSNIRSPYLHSRGHGSALLKARILYSQNARRAESFAFSDLLRDGTQKRWDGGRALGRRFGELWRHLKDP